jgi:4-carboxymuconolactone decarboxylase
MSDNTSGLGGRLPLFQPSELSPAQKRNYATAAKTYVPWAQNAGFRAANEDGTLIGPFNPSLLSPQVSDAFYAMQDAEQKYTTLADDTRQVVILTVGSVWRSDYELYAHTAVGKTTGLSADTMRQLATGSPADGLSDDQRLAQRFTQQITADHHIDDDLYGEVKAAFGEQGMMDILYLAGIYDIVCSQLNTFKVPVPAD